MNAPVVCVFGSMRSGRAVRQVRGEDRDALAAADH